jgi:hypothetical protein
VQEAVLLKAEECVDKNESGGTEPPREHVRPSVRYIYGARTLGSEHSQLYYYKIYMMYNIYNFIC